MPRARGRERQAQDSRRRRRPRSPTTVPAVRLGDLPHDRQAEARAGQPARRRERGRSGRRRAAGPRRRSRAVVADGQLAAGDGAPRPAPPGGLHFAALSSRFADRPVEPRARRRAPRSGSSVGANRGRGRVAPRPLDRLRRPARSRRTLLAARRSALAVARQLDQVADQHGQLVELGDARRASIALALAGGQRRRAPPAPRRSCAGCERRAQLVRRVGHQLALRAREALAARRASC